MAHCIHGYVAKEDDLLRVFGRCASLGQGFGFVPNPDKPSEDVVVAQIPTVAWIETDYFGGAGTQGARLWKDGKLVFEDMESSRHPIDKALSLMGVVAGNKHDEFDALGLGRYRDDEDWDSGAVIDISAEEHRRLKEWSAALQKKLPEEAKAGDHVRLLVQWQDVSGIPLFAYPSGTVLKVLHPDLTTGGVVVESSEGAVFSLKPDEYEITDEPEDA